MFIYLTSGTADYMEKLLKKYVPKEQMIVLHGSGNSVLLHETEGKTLFATPRKYEVIDSVNAIEQSGYFVFNNIPVADEGRPVFEKRFLSRSGTIEKEPGFIAYRLLRPIGSDTYVVLTQWTGPSSFEAWKNSRSFKEAHSKPDHTTPGVQQQNIFNAASYVTTYSGKLAED
ncbi:antibiotic biosynthesis monooxygenase family protein [Ureibacillus chungkukjangi]|uniref:Heme-degrading monooxygenase HmoA n=1 Tax=Ureibacillus chungkukjangi TaxID=1202712 RepID=A0A318TSJ9_9BACL|nr:antibiotic biosynthesis monooxygenase [Ureibacillus chungkukjangi]MCM3388622.1 antibiotic biosynthesis monooxygenase [Ureibacillus chungkukjangi]PYF05998.1 heme-degrading monooxygenase HmoA [Ureibacillus chungkukjangi]